jgi:hypothetical protein
MTSPDPGAVLWEALRASIDTISYRGRDVWWHEEWEALPGAMQDELRRVAQDVLSALDAGKEVHA